YTESLPLPDVTARPVESWGLHAALFPPSYWHWIHLHHVLREESIDLRHLPTDGPLLSLVVPVYRPSLWYFRESVQSVVAQTYQNWELCLCDDGSGDPELTAAMDEMAAADPRIRVMALEQNGGISRATNKALAAANGEFVVLLDHDDMLDPEALAEIASVVLAESDVDIIYTDEDKLDELDRPCQPHFKPDWDPDMLLSFPYLGHVTAIRHELILRIGGFRPEFDGSQDYDLLLRVTELTDRIAHIPEPLYSWRAVEGSAARDADAKPYAAEAAKRALADALGRRGVGGSIEPTRFPTFYRTRYTVLGKPRVSIIIPTRDGLHLLEPCVQSILERSTYSNYEIVVVDNQSSEGSTLEFLARSPVRVIRYPHRFNYSRQMNLAASSAESDVLLFLNNDTEVITPEWIEALLEHAMRPDVGAVGGRLYYTDGRVQHEGILVGAAGGWAWNVDHGGYFARGDLVRNLSAVTGACTMIRSTVYDRIGGNDERLRIAYNDVDICLRVRQAGLQVVYTPYAELFHHEGATRKGYEDDVDGPFFGERWQVLSSIDPYHSPWFLNNRTDTAFLLAL
ncbi:MAG: glycosyltransferase family 2 protein, partial [Sciscionella sp.]